MRYYGILEPAFWLGSMDIGSKSTRGWATGTDEILQQVGILETDANW